MPGDILSRDHALNLALLESRQRWRDLVRISADLAFETDAEGRFVFLAPESVLGWPAEAMVGAAADRLLAVDDGPRFNPFFSAVALRDCLVWLRRDDGTPCRMRFSVAPLYDQTGKIAGARGVARDATDHDRVETATARVLRRAALIDHLRSHVLTEVLGSRKVMRGLEALVAAIGAAGAAMLRLVGPSCEVIGATATVAESVRLAAAHQMAQGLDSPVLVAGPDGTLAALAATPTRFDLGHALLAWRDAPHDGWDGDELALLAAAGTVLRNGLEQEAVQLEMAQLARTDPLTGLPNRRAFQETLDRRIGRLEADCGRGVLLFIDLDGLKPVNDGLGHEAGDALLREAACLLRAAVRDQDLVARLGGDEFGVWLDGADRFAAAERAEMLCRAAASQLGREIGEMPDGLRRPGFSIGLAVREAGDESDAATLLRLADTAMYRAKQAGGDGWRAHTLGHTP